MGVAVRPASDFSTSCRRYGRIQLKRCLQTSPQARADQTLWSELFKDAASLVPDDQHEPRRRAKNGINAIAGARSSDSAIESNMHDDSPAWLIYERCVAAFVSDQHGSIDTSVQPNVILQGAISGAARQVDVLVDHRWHAGSVSRIIVDAKNRSGPLDLGDVEQFEGMMRDCRAARGIIVCTAGWSEAAARRAQQARLPCSIMRLLATSMDGRMRSVWDLAAKEVLQGFAAAEFCGANSWQKGSGVVSRRPSLMRRCWRAGY
jgi:hypothetical protein